MKLRVWPLSGSVRKRRRRCRRLLGAVTLFAPMLWFLLGDLARRQRHILRFPAPYKWYYRGSLAVSAVFWLVLALAMARRRSKLAQCAAVVFVLLFVLSSGTQGGFYSLFHWYLNLDAELYSHSLARSLIGTLPLSRFVVWFHFAASLVAGLVFVRLARKYARPSKIPWIVGLGLSPVVIAGMVFVPVSYAEHQAATADVLYFHAMVGSYKEQLGIAHATEVQRPQERRPLSVPRVVAKPARSRNVILILEESLRADVTCIEYEPHCALATPFSNRAAPGRIPFLQWRSLDSSTTLSCSTIWTGLLPSDPLVDLETAPSLWGYAKAAGYDTGYFSAQHLVFQNLRMELEDEPIDHFAGGTTIALDADWSTGPGDMKLTDWVIDHFAELREPFFVVVHYSQLHTPYVFDARYAPFWFDRSQNERATVNRVAHNKNIVYFADMAVGKLVDFVRSTDPGKRTVIAYTSDHAESIGDHGYGGHTYTLFDSELHVPTWIDAPSDTLTPDERTNLESKRDAYLTHIDFAPTLLDLLGLWDDPALAPFRAHMPGHPITRGALTVDPLPITSCAWTWECERANWGFMQGSRKLHARQGNARYDCYDVARDPGELKNLGEDRCPDLAALARGLFPDMKAPARPYRPLR